MFYFIGQLFFGLIIGMFMKLILPPEYPISLLRMILLGLAGSIIGTFISYALFGEQLFVGLSLATISAVIVLFIYSRLTGKPRNQQPRSLP